MMKAATVQVIKEELSKLPAAKLTAICLRLAKFKKENKELLTYLLFEAGDQSGYVQSVKNEMEEQFEAINKTNIYFIKKMLRKILRTVNKHNRYLSDKNAEVDLLIFFCRQMKEHKIPVSKSTVLANLYETQKKKIEKLIASLHEDLQYDYLQELKKIGTWV